MPSRSPRSIAIPALVAALVVAGCANEVSGAPVAAPADAVSSGDLVGGKELTANRSGLRADAPPPTPSVVARVTGADNGPNDQISFQLLSDIEEYWAEVGLPMNRGRFKPPTKYISWDASAGPLQNCGKERTLPNATFCSTENSVMWERAARMSTLRQLAGDLGMGRTLAHEIGHSVDYQVGGFYDEVIVGEQRADCYSGSYMGWVAEGNSQRFTLESGGVDAVLQSVPLIADHPEQNSHGSSPERMWAFQHGFMNGPEACAAIDMTVIASHRDGVPGGWDDDAQDTTATFTDELVDAVANSVFATTGAATGLTHNTCADTAVAVCPDGNIYVDVATLNAATVNPAPGIGGDGTALSVLMGALVQPWVKNNGTSPTATACAVGAAARKMDDSAPFMLTSGDLDEMVIEMLLNGGGATDAEGNMPVSGFERVRGFLQGVYEGLDSCKG